jgi:cytochrome c oxidase cbb3-type subunit 3
MMLSNLLKSVLVAIFSICLAASAGAQATQDHPGQYSQAEIDAGTRVYNSQCSQCHGANGDQVSGIDLRRAQFRRAATDEDLAQVITKGVVQTGMPPFALQPAELTGVIAYIRAGFDNSADVRLGNAARGRAIFAGKGACGSCHRINGHGPRTAPDLSDVGMARSPAAVQRTLLDPTSAMLPINRPVRLVTNDGKTITGRRLNEDTKTVQLIDSEERLLSIAKRDLRSFVVETKSTMPSYASRLTADEIADVVAYLLTLKELK